MPFAICTLLPISLADGRCWEPARPKDTSGDQGHCDGHMTERETGVVPLGASLRIVLRGTRVNIVTLVVAVLRVSDERLPTPRHAAALNDPPLRREMEVAT